MPARPQTSIPTLMNATALLAFWLALYQFHASLAWTIFPWIAVGIFFLFRGRIAAFFWLPLVLSIYWLALTMMGWWGPYRNFAIPISAAVSSTVAIYIYASNRTLAKYRGKHVNSGVIFSAMGYSAIAGVLVGLMLGTPLLAITLLNLLLGHYAFDFHRWLTIGVGMPFCGCFVGLILGIAFGFIFDMLVTLDNKNLSLNKNVPFDKTPIPNTTMHAGPAATREMKLKLLRRLADGRDDRAEPSTNR